MAKSKNKRKKQSSIPKRKRFTRKRRLLSAKSWIPKYPGKNIVKGYAKRFGVDLLCAIIELKLLGVKINIEYEQKIRQLNKNRKIKKKKEQDADLYLDSDYYFFYIVGYTSNGFPYGITWEEARKNPELFSDEKEGINENI